MAQTHVEVAFDSACVEMDDRVYDHVELVNMKSARLSQHRRFASVCVNL